MKHMPLPVAPHLNYHSQQAAPVPQQKDWIRELATMITCIREDIGLAGGIGGNSTALH